MVVMPGQMVVYLPGESEANPEVICRIGVASMDYTVSTGHFFGSETYGGRFLRYGGQVESTANLHLVGTPDQTDALHDAFFGGGRFGFGIRPTGQNIRIHGFGHVTSFEVPVRWDVSEQVHAIVTVHFSGPVELREVDNES